MIGETIATLGTTAMATATTAHVSDVIQRQNIGGNIGGSIYGLVWGELSNMLNSVLNLNISTTTPTFSDRMYGYMFRLLAINRFERELTLKLIASGAYSNGDPDGLPFNAFIPLYGNIVSDYSGFARTISSEELDGDDTTRVNKVDEDGHIEVTNLFPDDLGQGEFENKWEVDNRNSILFKTKKLFEQGKINTLISRFGTKADGGSNDIDFLGKTGYEDTGISRGRNLKKVSPSRENGYNNPYCRVWTHHHQYKKYENAIRPFLQDKGFKKIHTWNSKKFEFNPDTDGEWGWKNDNPEWNHSVLNQQNGIVNITPKYDSTKTIHTKDCMFSIENLAWKDYNPYEFEKALSWEQRGPLGGRIMWFPPYGISFTENTNVQWNENTFIGRGEKVYTYTDTTRSGTLSFMMLTDHPSVTDYASWNADAKTTDEEGNNGLKDDVWNRFFAGCDTLDGTDKNSLMYYVEPTPMNYTFETALNHIRLQSINNPIDEQITGAVDDVTFFVFFPNNYSGYGNQKNKGYKDDDDFMVGYLLGGVNAQKTMEQSGNDVTISFLNSKSSEFVRGYEMMNEENQGITDDTNREKYEIYGSTASFEHYNGNTSYLYDVNKLWQYRIDGKYEVPEKPQTNVINLYAEQLTDNANYADTTSYKLNKSTENISQDLATDKTKIYSFAEFAYAVACLKNATGAKEYLSSAIGVDANRIQTAENLVEIMKGGLESVEVIGYANSHGTSVKNHALAERRASSVLSWITSIFGTVENTKSDEVKEIGKGNNDVNSLEAKLYRCVKCVLKFKKDSSLQAVATTVNGSTTIQAISTETGVPYNEIKAQLLYNGLISAQDAETMSASELTNLYKKMVVEQNVVTTGKKSELNNKIRYDNEMYFYKKFQKENPFVWKKLTDKLQYFDPAFHSMTPEGFNMRLTFLQQCTRQGNTITASDPETGTRVASNMAFGRPPFCVLRLGDFFNQMIVIRSINIVYDEDGSLTWDLNDEGVGVQPMIARVTITFDFIGGSDLAGPVRRLQNAMTFNYYANASLYDNRADRMYYEAEENLSTKMGGAGNDKPVLPKVNSEGRIIDKKGSYTVYNVNGGNKNDILFQALQEKKNENAELLDSANNGKMPSKSPALIK